jgi:hypothetical protein
VEPSILNDRVIVSSKKLVEAVFKKYSVAKQRRDNAGLRILVQENEKIIRRFKDQEKQSRQCDQRSQSNHIATSELEIVSRLKETTNSVLRKSVPPDFIDQEAVENLIPENRDDRFRRHNESVFLSFEYCLVYEQSERFLVDNKTILRRYNRYINKLLRATSYSVDARKRIWSNNTSLFKCFNSFSGCEEEPVIDYTKSVVFLGSSSFSIKYSYVPRSEAHRAGRLAESSFRSTNPIIRN